MWQPTLEREGNSAGGVGNSWNTSSQGPQRQFKHKQEALHPALSKRKEKTYHSQQVSPLFEGGTATKDTSNHDNNSSHYQDVGGGHVRVGGQQADVVTLFCQGPDSHCHHGTACQLHKKEASR